MNTIVISTKNPIDFSHFFIFFTTERELDWGKILYYIPSGYLT